MANCAVSIGSLEETIFADFAILPDPRAIGYKCRHPWINILAIALCAMICAAETFADMERFGEAKRSWLEQRLGLDLSAGIPSHDTFGRAFAALDAQAFSKLFIGWTQAIHTLSGGKIVAVDGKTLRHSFDTASGCAAIHMVSAWSQEAGIALGQVKVDDKSNEITAVPLLLSLLKLQGCIVTADAMNTQKAIAQQITSQGGDYVLALKANQPDLHAEVGALFERALANKWRNANADIISHSFTQSVDGPEHGRIETRTCWATDELCELHPDTRLAWSALRSIALVQVERVDKATGNKTSAESRFYISSLPADAAQLLMAVRGHWSIENNLHWILDIAFREDECRVRVGNAAQNLAILRQIALNLIKTNTTRKGGVKSKRLRAGWDNDFLLDLLAQP